MAGYAHRGGKTNRETIETVVFIPVGSVAEGFAVLHQRYFMLAIDIAQRVLAFSVESLEEGMGSVNSKGGV